MLVILFSILFIILIAFAVYIVYCFFAEGRSSSGYQTYYKPSTNHTGSDYSSDSSSKRTYAPVAYSSSSEDSSSSSSSPSSYSSDSSPSDYSGGSNYSSNDSSSDSSIGFGGGDSGGGGASSDFGNDIK